MSMTFTKLFSSITASTVWCEDHPTVRVWICMLAMCDKQGRIFGSIPGLAGIARVTVDECRIAVGKFLSPDQDSRTKVAEGRRLEEIDGGWKLINHAKYRAVRDSEERRAYKTEKQREYRSVDKAVDKSANSGPRRPDVEPNGHNAEAEAEAEKKNTLATEEKSVTVPKPRKAQAKPEPQTREQAIADLQLDPAFRNVDVAGECQRCEIWCKANAKQFSRKRFVNWLLKSAADASLGPPQFVGRIHQDKNAAREAHFDELMKKRIERGDKPHD